MSNACIITVVLTISLFVATLLFFIITENRKIDELGEKYDEYIKELENTVYKNRRKL